MHQSRSGKIGSSHPCDSAGQSSVDTHLLTSTSSLKIALRAYFSIRSESEGKLTEGLKCPSHRPALGPHLAADARVGQLEVVVAIMCGNQAHDRVQEAVRAL